MKILFIGGNGNISYYCLKAALGAGHEVYALNRGVTSKTRRAFPLQTHRFIHDIRDITGVEQTLGTHEFDCVVDFLCYTQEDARNAVALFKNRAKHYIFISSVTVYQRLTKYLPFKENTPQWAESDYDYALEKIRTEQLFMDAFERTGFPVTIVRPAHTYDTIVPVALGHNCFTVPQRYIDGKPVLIAGDGTNLWTLTHSRDFAGALLGIVERSSVTIGEDYHITGDEWLTWLDITRILLEALGLEAKPSQWVHVPIQHILAMEVPKSRNMAISYLGKAFRGQRMWCDIYDNGKIKKLLPEWKAVVSFEHGIRETLSWLNEQDVRRRFNEDLNGILEKLTTTFMQH